MGMENTKSCVDCGTMKCSTKEGEYPDFCPARNFTEKEKRELISLYGDDKENRMLSLAAAEVEFENYCRLTRVEETMEFAKKINAKKLGVATCVGLINESRILAKILRANGFEVMVVVCKTGSIQKKETGFMKTSKEIGDTMCNPLLQAKLLNEAKTDFNIVMGLCVGHDSLFYKYSEAPVTTLVAKDRVTGHNPAAPLYNAGSYYKKLLKKGEHK
ncbi:MAG TPA: DUF1847 domain-containing protein [Bacillota bacterium]|nr:DUF1847 domain-containing protein [Bacillota bacterium]